MHQYGLRTQRMQPDDILKHVTLMFQGATTQFDHERFALQKINICQSLAQYLGNQMMIANNVALRCPRKSNCHA
jgi:hypothetical protein